MKFNFLIITVLLLTFQCRSIDTTHVAKNDKNLYRAFTETGAQIKGSEFEHCKYDPKTDTLDQCKEIKVNFGY